MSTPSSDTGRLLAAIAHEEARLAELDEQCASARARIAALKADFRQLGGADTDKSYSTVLEMPGKKPTTSQGKVQLFRALFRGRSDLFALRLAGTFGNKRTDGAIQESHIRPVDRTCRLVPLPRRNFHKSAIRNAGGGKFGGVYWIV